MGLSFSKSEPDDAPPAGNASSVGTTRSTSSGSGQSNDRISKLWRNEPLHLSGLEPGECTLQRGLLWSSQDVVHSLTAQFTETDKPLPRPPSNEFRPEVMKTINRHPHLFKIVTPINIAAFEKCLRSHPNPSFVESVVAGLKEGFWPFANTRPAESYPLRHDASRRPPKSQEQRQFLIDQCNTEMGFERYSQPFDARQLFPGMYSMPIHAVPKPGTAKFRLVNDHSATDFSLNSMVSREEIAGARLDTIKDLADSLVQYRRKNPSAKLVLFKSDVKSAYRNLPMHPLWQVKQIVTVDGRRYVDRCNCFGNRASQRLWVGFMGLATWIAINERQIEHLKLYVDDSFSFDLASSTATYGPYRKKYPKKQVKLLQLWDELGIPHEEKKQLYGEKLVILGFEVDANKMTITVPKEKLEKIIQAIHTFCFPKSGSQTLQHFTEMTGILNWSLSAFPLLKPGLRALYEKIDHDLKSNAQIPITPNIRFELSWFAAHAKKLGGIHIIKSIAWKPAEADHIFFCNAARGGLGCYFPEKSTGYRVSAPPKIPQGKDNAYFLKALCVCWAVHLALKRKLDGRVLIFTDNLDTVKMYDTLSTPIGSCNQILMSTVDVLIKGRFTIQVVVVSGRKENDIADALARGQSDRLKQTFPDVTILESEPLPVLPSPPQNAGWLW